MGLLFLTGVLALALPIGLGYSLFLMLIQRRRPPLPLGLSIGFALGYGLISQWILALGILRIPFSLYTIDLPLWGVTLLLSIPLWRSAPRLNPPFISSEHPKNILFYVSLVYIAFYLVYIFWAATNIPIYAWDAIATHSFTAKVLFFERSLVFQKNFPHYSYPLHIPFIEMWINLHLNRWDDQIIKIIFPFYLLAIIIPQYYFLKERVRPCWALLGVILLLSCNFFIFQSTIGYRDVTLLCYNFLAVLCLLWWHQKKIPGLLLLASLFAGFTTFVKLEGSGYLVIHTLALLYLLYVQTTSLRKKLRYFLLFCLPSYGMCLSYHIYKYFFITKPLGLAADTTKNDFDLYTLHITFSKEVFHRFFIILLRFLNNMFWTNNWGIFWFLFFASLFHFSKKKSSPEIKVLLLNLMFLFGVYFLGLTLTQQYFWVAESHAALSRILMHFLPLAATATILLSFDTKKAAF